MMTTKATTRISHQGSGRPAEVADDDERSIESVEIEIRVEEELSLDAFEPDKERSRDDTVGVAEVGGTAGAEGSSTPVGEQRWDPEENGRLRDI